MFNIISIWTNSLKSSSCLVKIREYKYAPVYYTPFRYRSPRHLVIIGALIVPCREPTQKIKLLAESTWTKQVQRMSIKQKWCFYMLSIFIWIIIKIKKGVARKILDFALQKGSTLYMSNKIWWLKLGMVV